MPMSKEKFAILPFVTGLVREREQAIRSGGLALDLRGDEGQLVEGDPRQLGRALGHLIDNAIGATGKGGRILVEIAKEKAGSRIVISDNGRGMDKVELARGMDSARPGSDGRPERRQGLGIALARPVSRAHGGTVKRPRSKGRGTKA